MAAVRVDFLHAQLMKRKSHVWKQLASFINTGIANLL